MNEGSVASALSLLENSNWAGQAITLLLLIYSITVWGIMLGKHWSLKAFIKANQSFQDSLQQNRPDLDSDCPYARIWRTAQQKGPLREAKMDTVLDEQIFLYESKMVVLGSLGNGAPLLGLLGTVWGVMDAFSGIAMAQNASLQALAPGVAGALLTTVMGLLVAIPASIGYNLLAVRIKKMTAETEHFSRITLASLGPGD